MTGSLVCSILFSCRDITWTARFPLKWTVCGTDWVLPAGYQVLLQEIAEYCTMDAVDFSAVDNRAGVTFEVELYSTNHVYLHRPNAFGFWQMRLHLCYETLKRISNFSELA